MKYQLIIQKPITKLPQDKHTPLKLDHGVELYSDNILVEFSLDPSDLDHIVDHYGKVFATVYGALDRIEAGRYSLLPLASHVFDDEELTDPRAFLVGCNPSLRVWKKEMYRPDPFTDGRRTAGAHLHCWRADYKTNSDGKLMSFETKEELVMLLDLFVGCSMVIFDRDESAVTRKKIYGGSGDWRDTPGGIEFRTPSNYYLRTPELAHLFFDLVAYTLTHFNNNTGLPLFDRISGNEIEKAVNECDVPLARKLLQRAALPRELMERVEKDYRVPSFEEAWGIRA